MTESNTTYAAESMSQRYAVGGHWIVLDYIVMFKLKESLKVEKQNMPPVVKERLCCDSKSLRYLIYDEPRRGIK